MKRLTEIQKAIEKLSPDDQEELRKWLNEYPEDITGEWTMIAEKRIQEIDSGKKIPLDGRQVLDEMHSLAKRLAQQ
jgi:hypothetical protein